MQNDMFGSHEEVEPRRMPKQASTFDSRPFPVVPEVSLIMDKPNESKQIVDSSTNTVRKIRPTVRDTFSHTSESYASWKGKRFSQQSTKSQSPLNHNYSSEQYTNNSPNSHRELKQRSQSPNHMVDFQKHSFKDENTDNEFPRKYIYSNRSKPTEPSNQNTSNYAVSNADSNYKNNNFNHTSRSCNEQNTVSLCNSRSLQKTRISNEKFDVDRRRYSDEKERSEERKQYDYSHAMETYDMRQKERDSKFQRSPSYSSSDFYAHRNIPVEHDYQPKYYRSEYLHHSGCCSMNHSNHNTETETTKNLLQVIISQNEQIKNLQKQLERLLKLHEQSLKNKNQCTCQLSNEIAYQNPHMYEQPRTTNLPIVHNNVIKENERCFPDLKLQDEKSKKTILEQKVSIGVMTSFELKVQNNPSLVIDSENKQKHIQEKVKPNLDTTNMIKNLVNDTGEMIKKKPNFFTPTPLENISEGSESHMSSMRHSHLGLDFTKQSVEQNQDIIDIPNTNFNKKNYEETETNKYIGDFNRENGKCLTDADYDISEEPINEKTKNDTENIPYQYDYQFENLYTSSEDIISKQKNSDEFNAEPLMSNITKMKNIKCNNFADECLSLSGSELDVDDRSPPSPEPSIHLDMQEFSSETGSLPPQQATKVGWTLYNNVLDQVNQILQNSPLNENQDSESLDSISNNEKKEYDNNFVMDTVKAATLEQLTKLGISFSENLDQRKPHGNKKVMFDPSYYPRQIPESHLPATNGSLETNTSMHMKALAMKYLNDEQLGDVALQKPQTGVLRHASSLQNTNMSFATMHYLQRYHLLPGNNSSPAKEMAKENYRPGLLVNERVTGKTADRREPSPRRYQQFAGTSKANCPSKILDISTLKQQPKLL